MYGEALSADHEAIGRATYADKDKLLQYTACARCNADELRRFTDSLRDAQFEKTPPAGEKMDKSRVTVFACCTVNETEEFLLMFIR